MHSASRDSTERKQKGATIPRLHERKQQVVRDAIWDAATDLFSDRGFNETTVDDIANAAGVSRRSFFRYFESKNDLMAYATVSFGAELVAAIDACPKTYSLYEVLRATVNQVALGAATRARTEKILAILSKYPDARAAQSVRLSEVQNRVTQALSHRCKRAGEGELAAKILAGLIVELTGVTVEWWYGQGKPDMADAVEHTFATLSRVFGEDIRAVSTRTAAPRTSGRKTSGA